MNIPANGGRRRSRFQMTEDGTLLCCVRAGESTGKRPHAPWLGIANRPSFVLFQIGEQLKPREFGTSDVLPTPSLDRRSDRKGPIDRKFLAQCIARGCNQLRDVNHSHKSPLHG